MQKTYETLSQAIEDLKSDGYTQDFNLHPDWIELSDLKTRFTPEQFHVDSVHRFEGMTNPDDSAVLYAVSSDTGVKGLLVDAYGAYTEGISQLMIEKLRIDQNTAHSNEKLRTPINGIQGK